jgi:hypothetical protein
MLRRRIFTRIIASAISKPASGDIKTGRDRSRMIANEFLLIANENGLPKEAARIELDWSRSERVTGTRPASCQASQADPGEADAQHRPG